MFAGRRERERAMVSRHRGPFIEQTRWLLCATLCASIILHLTAFWGSSLVLMFEPVIVSDLTFQDPKEEPPRNIPRPRPIPREISSLDDVKNITSYNVTAPSPVGPIQSDSPPRPGGRSLAGMSVDSAGGEGIRVPAVPSLAIVHHGLNITEWAPKKTTDIAVAEYASPQHYLDMVSFRIEKTKEYPERARLKREEGIVSVRFVITPTGDVRDAEVVRSSRHTLLDEAALKAVKDAAPFPKPPAQLFKGEVPLQVSVVFELKRTSTRAGS